MSGLKNFPIVRPARVFDFRKSKTVPPELTFTRASSATYTDINGEIKTAPSNSPRVDYDPVTGDCLGLLVEPQRTNWYRNSHELVSNASSNAGIWNGWFTTYCILEPTTLKTPLGTNATRMKTTSANSSFKEIQQSVRWEANSAWAYTLVVKADTHNIIQLHGNSVLVNEAYVNIDISTGVLGTGSTDLLSTIKTKMRPDGWCIITVTGKSVNTEAAIGWFTFSIQKDLNQGRGAMWASRGTESILISHVQLEWGQSATSYIPTSKTEVATRASESCTFNNTSINTAIMDIGDFQFTTNSFTKFLVLGNTKSGHLKILNNNNTKSYILSNTDGKGDWVNEKYASNVNGNTNLKFSISNTQDTYIGTAGNIFFGNQVTTPTGWNGNYVEIVSGQSFTGHIKSISLYSRALVSDQLMAVSRT